MNHEGESWAHRWNRWAAGKLAYVACGVLALLAIVTFADVIARYAFNRPFSFTVEVTELAMGLIVYFGVGLTTHETGHVAVDAELQPHDEFVADGDRAVDRFEDGALWSVLFDKQGLAKLQRGSLVRGDP